MRDGGGIPLPHQGLFAFLKFKISDLLLFLLAFTKEDALLKAHDTPREQHAGWGMVWEGYFSSHTRGLSGFFFQFNTSYLAGVLVHTLVKFA